MSPAFLRTPSNRLLHCFHLPLPLTHFVLKAFFAERVIHLDPDLLRNLEGRGQQKHEEEEDDDYYDYPQLVVYDKLDPNEVLMT